LGVAPKYSFGKQAETVSFPHKAAEVAEDISYQTREDLPPLRSAVEKRAEGEQEILEFVEIAATTVVRRVTHQICLRAIGRP
jgi:hypothetical protein